MPRGKTTARRHGFTYGEPERPVQRESLFQLVLNTNVMPANEADANRIADDLQDTVDAMLTDTGMEAIIRHRPSSKWPSWDAIDSIEGEHSIEMGSEVHRLHAQVFIVVKHHSNIHLDRDAIKRFFRLNATQPEVRRLAYVHIQGGATTRGARAYVTKGVSHVRKF